MKFIVYGAGAIGSLFAALLSENHEVLVVGRKEHIEAIFRHGLIVEGITNGVFYPETEYDGSRYDVIILSTKAYDTETAIKEAVEKFGVMPVVSIQNGLRNEERIAEHVGWENVVGGVTTHGVTFMEPGRIKHAGRGKTLLGGFLSNEMANRIAKAFNESGIETVVTEDIMEEIWRKSIVNSAINGLTALLRCRNGELKKIKEIVMEICEEGEKIAMAYGYDIHDAFERAMEVIDNTSMNYSSMLQDVLNGKRTEVEEINGAIAEMGRKKGINACMNDVITKLIKGMENVRHLG
ncbi:MAG: 2-dehydropantoate 2-reductase [Thermoplasmata archaeon]|nr:2-dehydropantoate 2-reductase [Thermoplasmata archaeon]